MNAPSKVCLNMIVRNESAIIERCLESVADAVDAYVICDTGSSDDTVLKIRRFMDARGIVGKVHETTFQDFGSARNEALDVCRQSAFEFDYLLLTDADMELRIADPGYRHELSDAAYAVRQHNQISYYNTRLIRRDADARYVGMTHEYLRVTAPVKRLESLSFLDHACGSSRAEKFERDVRLLKTDLERDPHNGRAMFYLAQTYRGQGCHREAIEWYRRRVAEGGWDEELWYARYAWALSHRDLGEADEFLLRAREAYAFRPSRAEPLHAMARHYRDVGRFEEAMALAEVGAALPRPSADSLFVHDDIYRHGFKEEISIAGFYSCEPQRRQAARDACADLAIRRDVPAAVRFTARQNWVHYARSAAELFGACTVKPIAFATEAPWRPFNPSICKREGRLEMILRTSNYRIEPDGEYVVDVPPIRTRNYLCELDENLDIANAIEMQCADDGKRIVDARIAGFEDCRIFDWDGRRCCVFNVRDRNPELRCEMAFAEIADDGVTVAEVMRGYRDEVHQKNWIPFVRNGELLFVYSTDPLVVLAWREGETPREIHRGEPDMALDHLRGGSQALPLRGGWLYLTHEVSVFDATRVYLHRFVHLGEDFSIKAFSEAFYFVDRRIEYAAGMVQHGDSLLITFGIGDHEAAIARLDLDSVMRVLRR